MGQNEKENNKKKKKQDNLKIPLTINDTQSIIDPKTRKWRSDADDHYAPIELIIDCVDRSYFVDQSSGRFCVIENNNNSLFFEERLSPRDWRHGYQRITYEIEAGDRAVIVIQSDRWLIEYRCSSEEFPK